MVLESSATQRQVDLKQSASDSPHPSMKEYTKDVYNKMPARNSTFNKILAEMQAMHDKKNHDYASEKNPYSNFEESAKFAGISVEQALANLCGTKDARMTQLMSGKEPKNESKDDTLLDRAIYTVIWLAYRRDQASKLMAGQGIMSTGGQCGKNEAHYVPPSLGESGFFICEYKKEKEMCPDDRYLMDRYSEFWHTQSLWSQVTFGPDSARGPSGPILHLYKEVSEELLELDPCGDLHELRKQSVEELQMELVDCFFLVTDAARRSGLNYTQFMDLVDKKMKINQVRKWGKPSTDQPVEHIRDESSDGADND